MTANGQRAFTSRPCVRATSRIMALVWLAVIPALSQTFIPTGDLNTARNAQRAIMLNNGKVLIVGGYDIHENALVSCELYDPASTTFASTGNLNVARRNFGIALLDNGTVLVAGGYDNNFNPLTSAEIYDPATGLFTFTGSMNAARVDATATLLNDGTVLIAGGFGASGGSLSSAELYFPSTGTFVPTGSLNYDRGFATATALLDGTVLIEAGWTSTTQTDGNAIASAEVYDPSTASFSPVGSLGFARVRNTATLLNDGTVLVAGGEDSSDNDLASAEIYNPTTRTFAPTGSLNAARGDHAATLLTNGTVLVEGGFACQPSNCDATRVNSTSSAEIYDPRTGTFNPTASLAVARQVHTATLLTNGLVLIAGGWSDSSVALTSAELYQPASFTPPNLVSISVTPANPSLVAGASQPLVAVGTFADNSTHRLASTIWSSSDSAIASVTNDSGSNSGTLNDSTNSGVIFGVSPGTATITACAGSVCGSATVTVASSAPASQGFVLSGTPESRTVALGQIATFTVLLAPDPGFSGAVTLKCRGIPLSGQCSISPSSLKIREVKGATATVTIVTTPSALSAGTKKMLPFSSNTFLETLALFSLMFSLGLCFLFSAGPRKRASAGLLLILLNLQLVACAAGARRQSTNSLAQGRYTITVTAASGVTSRAVQFSLIVE